MLMKREVLQLQDQMTGVKERLNSFISPANTVLPASLGPGVYTPTCKRREGPRGAEQDTGFLSSCSCER